MVRFKIVLDTRTPKKDGTFPLSLRTTFGKNVRLINLKTYYTQRQYNLIFVGTPTPHTLEHRRSADSIVKKAYDITKTLSKFDYDEFKDLLTGKKKFLNPDSDTLRGLYDVIIDKKRKSGSVKTASSYQSSINSLEKFRPNLTISDITPQFLQDYEDWYIKNNEGKLTSAVGIYLRNLRAIIKMEISKNKVPVNYTYPFGRYTYTIPVIRRPKKALSFGEIQSIIQLNDFETESQRTARDLWLFQFYCNGINLKDLLLLKWTDQEGDFFYIKREKTKNSTKSSGTYIKIPIIPSMKNLLDRIGDKNSLYVLGFLKDGMAPNQIDNVKGRIGKIINTNLKYIQQKLNLSITLLTKSARDAYATCLKRSNVSIDQIAEMLGHTSTKITKSYLDSFDDDQLHEINSCLPS